MKAMRSVAALLAYFAVAVLSTQTYAQQAVGFAAALDLARNNNPDWRGAQQELEISRSRLTTTRLLSPFNPIIEGQGGPRRIPGE